MKIAITGKGGVGKTTITALLARALANQGKQVIAIDANPDANLALALGMSSFTQELRPISEMADLIEERTGAKPGTTGGLFKLNPRVDDIPERFSIIKDNIRLILMGGIRGANAGCMCPESSFLKSLVSHLVLARSEVVLMDMEAGVEHLGRGTAKGVSAFIIVVEPGQRSFQTAHTVRKMASGLGIKRVFVIGSKVRNDADRNFIKESLPDFEILGFVSYNLELAEADRTGRSVFESSPRSLSEAAELKHKLESLLQGEG
jgi:CO dehydrogenase maturation factor